MARYVVRRVSRMSGTPHSIAAGVACGVAISFTPFIGLHLLGAFLLCLLVRGNYVAAAAGTLVGNPWTFPLIWVAAYQLGTELLGTRAAQLEPVHRWDLATFLVEAEAVFWPMVVGGIPLAVLAGLATYFPLSRMIAAYQDTRRRRREGRRRARLRARAPAAPSNIGAS